MAAGFEFQGRCHASAADAVDAYYTAAVPQIVSGTVSYATTFTKVGAVWKAQGYSIDAAGLWTLRYETLAPEPAFPDCDTAESFQDGMTVGWGIAAAMLVAWSFNYFRRSLSLGYS